MFVLDSHCDTPSQIVRLRDLRMDNDHSQLDYPKLRRGGVDGVFFALYTPSSLSCAQARARADEMLAGIKASVAANSDQVALATSALQALDNQARGLISIFIGMENGAPIGDSLDQLQRYYDEGVRYLTLAHSGNNLICDSCSAKEPLWGGLSPFGREVVAEMNRMGMLVDVSHISDASFYDVLKYSTKPVVATHSCCRSLCDVPRNMTDEMMLALADNGGVIQITFYPPFLDASFASSFCSSELYGRADKVESEFISNPADKQKRSCWNSVLDEISALERPSYKRIADHVDHAVSLVGVDHVGLGSDFDGMVVTPSGMEDAGCFSKLLKELENRGYSPSEIEKIAGGNFFRVLDA